MSNSSRIPRKPIVSAGRGRHGPFGALVAAASADPLVARGLALAYASLETEARQRVVEVIVNDAVTENISVSTVLVSLLAVEEDADVARQIADAMTRAGGAGLEASALPRALVAGDQESGGVVLIRPLHGTFVEALALAWSRERGITHAIFDPLVHDTDAAKQVAHLPPSLTFEEMPIDFAIDLVAPALWNHRRISGVLPPGIRRFADLFSIDPVHDEVQAQSAAQYASLDHGPSSGGDWESWDGPDGGALNE